MGNAAENLHDLNPDQDAAETGGTQVDPQDLSDQEKLNAISERFDQINRLKDERSEVQSEIQAAREAIVAMGIPKKAFDMAMQYHKMDDEQRKGFDTAYALVRKAIGLPVQMDMFEDGDNSED